MSVQNLLLAIIALSAVGLAAQPFGSEVRPTATKQQSFVGSYQDRCNRCGCKGGPGWRVRLTGQCAYWKTLKKQCGDPPSTVWCSKES